jgi:hypothetical protein
VNATYNIVNEDNLEIPRLVGGHVAQGALRFLLGLGQQRAAFAW